MSDKESETERYLRERVEELELTLEAMRAEHSSVNVTKDEVERSQNGNDVGHIDTLENPRHDGDVVETRGADLCSERSKITFADNVVTHLAEWILC